MRCFCNSRFVDTEQLSAISLCCCKTRGGFPSFWSQLVWFMLFSVWPLVITGLVPVILLLKTDSSWVGGHCLVWTGIIGPCLTKSWPKLNALVSFNVWHLVLSLLLMSGFELGLSVHVWLNSGPDWMHLCRSVFDIWFKVYCRCLVWTGFISPHLSKFWPKFDALVSFSVWHLV